MRNRCKQARKRAGRALRDQRGRRHTKCRSKAYARREAVHPIDKGQRCRDAAPQPLGGRVRQESRLSAWCGDGKGAVKIGDAVERKARGAAPGICWKTRACLRFGRAKCHVSAEPLKASSHNGNGSQRQSKACMVTKRHQPISSETGRKEASAPGVG